MIIWRWKDVLCMRMIIWWLRPSAVELAGSTNPVGVRAWFGGALLGFLLLHWRPAFSEMNMCTCNIMIYWNVVTCRLYKRNMHDINDIWLEYMSSTKHHKEQIKEMTEVMKLWHKKQDMFWRLSWVYYQKILADSGSCWHRDKFFIVDSLDRLRRALLAGLWNSSASLLHTV